MDWPTRRSPADKSSPVALVPAVLLIAYALIRSLI